ncbi:hypothetical protein SLE2022_131690 [Rubroshorea leprosula]
MQSDRFQHGIFHYNVLIDGLFKAGRVDIARESFAGLPMKGKQPSDHTYIIMLRGLYNAGYQMKQMSCLRQLQRLAAGEMAALIRRGFKDFLRAALNYASKAGGDPMVENEVSIDASAVNMIVSILFDDGKD